MNYREDLDYSFTPLPKPIPITEQRWPEGTRPLVHSRTMTFNHEGYIRDCIEGILIQETTFPVLVLIHDDASTDKTTDIINEYQQKYPHLIKVFYQTENSYTKLDKHERRAEFMSWRIGKYEAICEGDDYWTDPLKLQKQVDFLERNPDYGLIFTDADHFIEETGRLIKDYDKSHKRNIPTGNVLNLLITKTNPYKTCTSLFRISLIKKTSHLVNTHRFKTGDRQLWVLIASQSNIAYLKDTTSVYRVRSQSASHFRHFKQAKIFAQNGYKLTLYHSSLYRIPIDKNKQKRRYVRFLITYIITKNDFSHLKNYMKYPEIIIEIFIKEKLLRPFLLKYKQQ